jgi:hypothetical protein
MIGTISLGIYDQSGKLVRVLHRQAGADEFVAALDGFITHWDGLDDNGHPLPPGHYSASGYMVGMVNIRPVTAPSGTVTVYPASSGSAASPIPSQFPTPLTLASILPILKLPDGKPFVPQPKIHAALEANPLKRDAGGSADLIAALDTKGSWLELADGLPLKQISATPNLKWIAAGRSSPTAPIVIFQSDGATFQEFIITNISDMMSFDCGPFDLPAPPN